MLRVVYYQNTNVKALSGCESGSTGACSMSISSTIDITDDIPNRATRTGVSIENASPRTGI